MTDMTDFKLNSLEHRLLRTLFLATNANSRDAVHETELAYILNADVAAVVDALHKLAAAGLVQSS